MMENETLKVGTLFHCDRLLEYEEATTFDPLWIHTVKGCRIVQLLQDMYRFKITYVIQKFYTNDTIISDAKAFYQSVFDDDIDIYTRPITLHPELLNIGYPVEAIYKQKLGFILHRPKDRNYFQVFYSKPFTRPVWNCLYGMAFAISLIFYLLQLWEKQVVGSVHENGVTFEMLMVMGAYCQHIPPLHAVLSSRRTSYFVFLIFSYIIYSFYTSNLLSHLVNDKREAMDIESLSKCDYKYLIVNSTKLFLELSSVPNNKNSSIITDNLLNITPVSIQNGLRKVKTGKYALLSDYTSLDPFMKSIFSSKDLCQLVRVDLFSGIKKYFFTSKNFAFKERIKIGAQRAKEVGVFKRLVTMELQSTAACESKTSQTTIIQIFTPLVTLFCAYALAVLILFAERYYYQRYRLFPYVD